MQPDPTRIQDTLAWFRKAVQDLRRVEILLAVEPPDIEGALYHSQQAAEKALKGYLTWHDVPFRRVHEIVALGEQSFQVDPSLKEVVNQAGVLTKYAWKFRYPGAPYEPSVEEGQTALALARELMEAIIIRLPEEVRGTLRP
jgi:HEPN domain-containing protein